MRTFEELRDELKSLTSQIREELGAVDPERGASAIESAAETMQYHIATSRALTEVAPELSMRQKGDVVGPVLEESILPALREVLRTLKAAPRKS